MKFKLQLAVSFSAILMFSCIKTANRNGEDDCAEMMRLHAKPFTPVAKGEQIRIQADSSGVAEYRWTGPGNFSSTSQSPLVNSYAQYSDRGWYYVSIGNRNCENHLDSVYVDVTLPQGSPSCSLINNSAQFNNLFDQTYSYIRFNSGVSDAYEITANGSNGDLVIQMSPWWRTHALEDGIYYSTATALYGDEEIDQVFISNVNQSIYWQSHTGTAIYVSHVNGKARVSFCGLEMSGSLGGPSYTTVVNGQVTEP